MKKLHDADEMEEATVAVAGHLRDVVHEMIADLEKISGDLADMIAEGLLSPYETGNENPQYLEDWAVSRIRQLSAHEVGHTIGLGHNYYNSQAGRISVMDSNEF